MLILIAFTCILHVAKAQTFDEWFRQKKTKKKYLLEQIAALQVFIADLKKGYDAAHKGLTTIGNIKNGDLGQHTAYFHSLNAVSPQVAKYARINDIITLQAGIGATCANTLQAALQANIFSTAEMEYIRAVFDRLDKDCLNTLQDLQEVATDGKLQMTDDERMRRIDKLYAETQSQYGFAQSYGSSIKVMALQKQREKEGIKTMDSWYGIKN